MNRKKIRIRLGALALGVAVAVVVTSTASAHMPTTITIRHQTRGCHAWSAANGPYKAALKIRVDRDASLVFVNNDVMPHKLVQVAGPKAHLSKVNMNRMSARAYVTFSQSGVYKFKTRPGDDYPAMGGMKTIGEDNVLTLTVTVK